MSDDSAVEAARRILAIDSDHIDSVDAIAVADAYLSSQSQVERMRAALEPFANYYRHRTARPFRGLDDVIHAIHRGDEHEAAIRLTDCERAAAALTPKEEK